ncbi:MAG: hypothetical protein ACRDV1_12800 [Actinomycetes bacterium]
MGAGQLLRPEQRSLFEQGWFDDVDTITDLRVRGTSSEQPQWTGHKAPQEVMHVSVEFNLQWRWLRDDSSMDEGPTTWGYALVRDGAADPWRIFDQGTG